MATAVDKRPAAPTAGTGPRPDLTKVQLEPLPINHRRDCPKARIESFVSDLPRSPEFPKGGWVQTTRCVDCGRDNHADFDMETEEVVTDG